ncbi:MAG: hypothetical protein OEU32_09920 [Acidimicrobiia bacterium]|nr:hypothetical protein [Acidimicrobiia bacterium]
MTNEDTSSDGTAPTGQSGSAPAVDGAVGDGSAAEIDDSVDDIASEPDRFDDAFGGPRNPDALARYLDRNFLMAGRRRIALIGLSALLTVGLVVVIAIAATTDTAQRFGGSDADFQVVASDGFVEFDGSSAGSATPVLDPNVSTAIDTPAVVLAGGGERIDRVVVDPDPAILPVVPGTVAASLVTFGARPHVALVGAPGWLTAACIQVSVIAGDNEIVDATWLASPIGACAARGVGDAALSPCVGPRVVLVPLDWPRDLGGDPASTWSILVDLVGGADGYESVLVSGRIDGSTAPGDLVAMRADRGSEIVTSGAPPATGPDGAACLVQ